MRFNKSIMKYSFFIGMIGVSSLCQANVPYIVGTWAGSETETLSGCFNPADDGFNSSSLTLIVKEQSGSSFSGTTDAGGDPFSGTIDVAGNISGTYTFSDTGQSGTFSGTILGTSWSTSTTIVSPGSDGCFGGGTQTLTGGGAAVAAQVEQSRQIVRVTNNIVSQHLATEVASAFSYMPYFDENKIAASSDQKKSQPAAFWGTVSLSEIHEESGINFDTDIYQFVGGLDKRIGDFFIGSALTYAYSETEQKGADSNSQVFGITPYAAYSVTDYMFISGLAGYNYTYIREEISGNDTDVHDYTLEGNLNFYKTFYEALILKSRLGGRFHHTYVSSQGKSADATADEVMWIGDVEMGYRFQNNLISFVGLNYEYFDREESSQKKVEHDGILYMRGGFDYPISSTLTLGAKVQTDLNDEDTDLINGSVTIRMAL